ncbi:MAG: winged helix-turn-helix transcriptional regulator [Candidatus Helarchaeota archaeon]|nr:winged helix-turn-helix transcriptional regulator [Candidatus Helarchaeota archaeon]
MEKGYPASLSQVESDILKVILAIKEKKKMFNANKIVKICKTRLNYAEHEIISNLEKLYQKNILVEGTQLLKPEILKNPKRNIIYQTIDNNPGIHLRELARELNFPVQTCSWHLVILEKFGFINSLKFKNCYCFGNANISGDDLRIHHILRNELNKKIITELLQYPKTKIPDLIAKSKVNQSTFHYHIEELENYGIVKEYQIENMRYLNLMNEDLLRRMLKLEKVAPISLVSHFIKESKPIAEEANEIGPESLIMIRRSYPVIEGDNFKIFIQIENQWNQTIINTRSILNFDDTVLEIVKTKPMEKYPSDIVKLREIKRSEKNSAVYWFRAKTCNSTKITGEIKFEDSFENIYSLPINPIPVDACFYIRPKLIAKDELFRIVQNPDIINTKLDLEFTGDFNELIEVILKNCSVEKVTDESNEDIQRIWLSGEDINKDWFIFSVLRHKRENIFNIELEIYSLLQHLIPPILNSLKDSITEYENRIKKQKTGKLPFVDEILNKVDRNKILPSIADFNFKKGLIKNELELIFKCQQCNNQIHPSLYDSKGDKWGIHLLQFENPINQNLSQLEQKVLAEGMAKDELEKIQKEIEVLREKKRYLAQINEKISTGQLVAVDLRYNLEKLYKDGVLDQFSFCNECKKWVGNQCWDSKYNACIGCTLNKRLEIISGESFDRNSSKT